MLPAAGLLIGTLMAAAAAGAATDTGTTVFEEGFAKGASAAWSKRETATMPGRQRHYLGPFGFENVDLALRDLPAHRCVTVTFDLVIIGSWDGNSLAQGPDLFTLGTADGRLLLRTSFSAPEIRATQAYPGFVGIHRNPSATGATESVPASAAGPGFTVYRLATRFAHAADSLGLRFEAVLNSGKTDEAWGVNWVQVTVANALPAADEQPVERRWSMLAANDGTAAMRTVQSFLDRGDEAVGFLAGKLAGTTRPQAADLLLDPTVIWAARRPSDRPEELLVPIQEERQRLLAAFVLQATGNDAARDAVAAWPPGPDAPLHCKIKTVAEDGSPLPFLPVTAGVGGQTFAAARGGADGTLTLKLPATPIDWLGLCSAATDRPRVTYRWVAAGGATAPPPTIILRVARPAPIGGVVRNDRDEPVPGATVVIAARRPGGPTSAAVEIQQALVLTDDQGRWSYPGMAADMPAIQIAVYHPDYPTPDNAAAGQPAAFSPVAALYAGTAVLRLSRGVPVTGVVFGADGHPVPSAYIEVGEDIAGAAALPPRRTDQQGRFTIPAAPDRPLTVTVKGYQHAPELRRLQVGGEPLAVDIRLKRPQRLAGTVVDAGGHPVEGAAVLLDTWRGARSLNTRLTTDSLGRFDWALAPADEIRVTVSKQGQPTLRDVPVVAGQDNAIRLPPVPGATEAATTSQSEPPAGGN